MSILRARRASGLLGLTLTTCLLSGLTAATIATSSPASGTTTSARAGAGVLHVGSYNIQMRRPMSQFRPAVRFIKSVADVAGLQEAGGAPRRRYLDGDKSWRIYHAPKLPQDPVIWNPRVYELVSAHQVKLSDAAMVEGPHGLVHQKAIYAPVVRLRQISTGYKFSVINVHLMVAAVNEGRPRPGKPRTYRVYTHQVKALKLAVRSEKSRGLPVYVTGDFNVGYVADRKYRLRKLPYHRLTSANMVANWKGKRLNNYGTHIDDQCSHHQAHCGAYIDQIWAPKPSATSTVYTRVIHSDHYPIMSTYSVPSSANYRPTVGTVGFATTAVSAPEWNKPWQARQNPMVFPLQGDLSHGFVDVQVADGTGVQGKDYTVDTSSLYDNDTTNDQVVVTSIPNTTPEPDKTFTLTLVGPFDTTITQATATGTLTNDD